MSWQKRLFFAAFLCLLVAALPGSFGQFFYSPDLLLILGYDKYNMMTTPYIGQAFGNESWQIPNATWQASPSLDPYGYTLLSEDLDIDYVVLSGDCGLIVTMNGSGLVFGQSSYCGVGSNSTANIPPTMVFPATDPGTTIKSAAANDGTLFVVLQNGTILYIDPSQPRPTMLPMTFSEPVEQISCISLSCTILVAGETPLLAFGIGAPASYVGTLGNDSYLNSSSTFPPVEVDLSNVPAWCLPFNRILNNPGVGAVFVQCANGSVVSWGWNNYPFSTAPAGLTATGVGTGFSLPAIMPQTLDVNLTQINCGYTTCLALTSSPDYRIFGWGVSVEGTYPLGSDYETVCGATYLMCELTYLYPYFNGVVPPNPVVGVNVVYRWSVFQTADLEIWTMGVPPGTSPPGTTIPVPLAFPLPPNYYIKDISKSIFQLQLLLLTVGSTERCVTEMPQVGFYCNQGTWYSPTILLPPSTSSPASTTPQGTPLILYFDGNDKTGHGLTTTILQTPVNEASTASYLAGFLYQYSDSCWASAQANGYSVSGNISGCVLISSGDNLTDTSVVPNPSGMFTTARAIYMPYPLANTDGDPSYFLSSPQIIYKMTQILTSTDITMGSPALDTFQTPFTVLFTSNHTVNCPGTPPSTDFACIGGVWTAIGSNSTAITISGPTLVIGNLSTTTIVVSGSSGASLNVSGCVSSSNLTVLFNLTSNDLTQFALGGAQNRTLISQDSSCSTNLSSSNIVLSQPNDCRKASTHVGQTTNVLSVLVSIDSSGCSTPFPWWGILICVVGGVLLFTILGILVFCIPRLRYFFLPFSKPREDKGKIRHGV